MYANRIPSQHDIVRLSTLVKNYPVIRSDIVRVARMWNFNMDVVAFLRLFPAEKEFVTRTDLVTKAEELAYVIRQQWESPKKYSFSS